MASNMSTDLDQSAKQCAAAQDAIVLTLLAAIEEPVGGDPGHVLRVRHFAQMIAEQLRREGIYRDSMSDDFLANLYRSSPLHDVGKIGIERSILGKPGPLTAPEFEAVKEHVTIGSRLLKTAAEVSGGSSFLSMAADVALYHHERFDGTGYRAGLHGEAIPLAARIVALADAYDALTSSRVYKPAISSASAKARIESESGRHFDPVIVQAFCAVYPKFVVSPRHVSIPVLGALTSGMIDG